ncbi:GRD-6 protein [Aphelenchoides avenae]|nr:GRD-6 protein [Aphelenchus avenae]
MRIAFEDYTPVNSGGHNEVIDGKHMDASDGAVFNEVSDDDDYGGGYSSSKVPTVVHPSLTANSSSLRSSRPNPMAIAPSARNMPSGVSASSSTEDRDLLYKSANMIPSSLSGLPRVAGSTYTSMRRPVNNRPASTRASIRDFNHGQGQHSPADLGFPLPECYRTATGHMCCNRLLEELIYASASEMIRANTNKCNIHQFSLVLANRAEREFQTSFEVIVGVGDFAAKAHFKDNLICKTIVNNKFVLIYATAEEYPIDMTNYVPPISGLIKA